MGIRGRIVALTSLSVAVAVILAVTGAYIAVRSELRGQADDALRGQAQAVGGIAGDGGLVLGFEQRLAPPPDLPVALPGGGAMPQRVTPEGELAEFPADADPLPVTEVDRRIAAAGTGEVLTDRTVNGTHYRVITVGIGDLGAAMLSRSLNGVDDVLANLRLVLALLLAGGVALAGGLGWLVARRVVAPIAELTDAAEEISETQDLTRPIPVTGDDEVARLARRFSAMLAALSESQAALGDSVESQRRLVADASHELRTPVASIRTDIETLLGHPDLPAGERAEILAAADERIEELSELIGDIIELARGDTDDTAAADDDVRLDHVVEEAIVRLGRHSPGRPVAADLAPAVVRARPDRVYRAVNNLLDNADKYSPEGEPIEVRVAEGVVEVADHGPGIPEADLPNLFERFWRGSTSRHRTGSGLGLAIVRQVATASGGEVRVENLERGGARFTLELPPAGPDETAGPGATGSG